MNAPALKMVATTFASLNENGKVDPKLAFLARAAVRFELVHIGEMDIDEAFDGLVACLQCYCSRDLVEKWEREDARRPKLNSKRNF
jgi:hypothetical protein